MSYHLLNTDGGMVNDGNRKDNDPPGEAAIAGVLSQIRNGREVRLGEFSKSIGPDTNDRAEYAALIEGLRFAVAEGATRIRVFVDSEFVVDQMNGRSQIGQEDLRPLHEEANELLNRFADHRVSWVPRERNQEADALVRKILYPDE